MGLRTVTGNRPIRLDRSIRPRDPDQWWSQRRDLQHEQGYDGDGVALNPNFLSGYAVIGDGEEFTFVDEFIPDFKYGLQNGSSQNANLQVTLLSINYPRTRQSLTGPIP